VDFCGFLVQNGGFMIILWWFYMDFCGFNML
jgi:hypothetical protein